ncbi:hypothetical protein ACMDCR_08715 [Labrys okinawensis]|uniref:hypothetical protein n=1 Tax=Labrys okinawensis TaxID=346911 RepID=UPI0039BC3719
MDAAYISALFGLAGAIVGGLASFSTTWLTQSAQLRERRREVERNRREQLFDSFITEATRLYGDALSHEKDDVADLVLLYAIVGRMRLTTSRTVVEAAERVLDAIVDTYLSPNRTLHELRQLARDGGLNFLGEFGEICRADLLATTYGRR